MLKMDITSLRVPSEGIFKDLISLDTNAAEKKRTFCVILHAISIISFNSEFVQERSD